MANFGKGLMYALKGSLEGLAAGAEKEDKEREELSKTILAGSLKNIGLAKQLQQEQKEKDKEMQAAIESIMKISLDETGRKPTRAQAIAAYNYRGKDAAQDLQKGLYGLEGEGEISDGSLYEAFSLNDTNALVENENEGGGLFSKGRNKEVINQTKQMLKAMGEQDNVTFRTSPTVSGVDITLGPANYDLVETKVYSKEKGTPPMIKQEKRNKVTGFKKTEYYDLNGTLLPDVNPENIVDKQDYKIETKFTVVYSTSENSLGPIRVKTIEEQRGDNSFITETYHNMLTDEPIASKVYNNLLASGKIKEDLKDYNEKNKAVETGFLIVTNENTTRITKQIVSRGEEGKIYGTTNGQLDRNKPIIAPSGSTITIIDPEKATKENYDLIESSDIFTKQLKTEFIKTQKENEGFQAFQHTFNKQMNILNNRDTNDVVVSTAARNLVSSIVGFSTELKAIASIINLANVEEDNEKGKEKFRQEIKFEKGEKGEENNFTRLQIRKEKAEDLIKKIQNSKLEKKARDAALYNANVIVLAYERARATGDTRISDNDFRNFVKIMTANNVESAKALLTERYEAVLDIANVRIKRYQKFRKSSIEEAYLNRSMPDEEKEQKINEIENNEALYYIPLLSISEDIEKTLYGKHFFDMDNRKDDTNEIIKDTPTTVTYDDLSFKSSLLEKAGVSETIINKIRNKKALTEMEKKEFEEGLDTL